MSEKRDWMHTDIREIPRILFDDFLTVLAIILFNLNLLFVWLMQNLTRIPPFSDFFRDKIYHHKNRDINDFYLQVDILLVLNKCYRWYLTFDKDQYFLTITALIVPRRKRKNLEKFYEKLDKKFSKHGMLFRSIEKNQFRIMKPITEE